MGPPFRITRLAAVAYRTANLDAMVEFYVEKWGLHLVASAGPIRYLKGSGPTAYLVALHQDATCAPGAGGSPAGFRHFSLAVESEAELARAFEWVQQAGHPIVAPLGERAEPGLGYAFTLRDPEGALVELVTTESPAADQVVLSAASAASAPPIEQNLPIDRWHLSAKPIRLSHLVLFSTDVPERAKFYESLGFRVTERLGVFMSFLTCDNSHHVIGIQQGSRAGVQHVAFDLPDAPSLMRVVYDLGERGTRRIWGPGRHQAGHNLFAYYVDPDRNVVEMTTELSEVPEGAPCVSSTDGVPDLWGSFPPVEMVV